MKKMAQFLYELEQKKIVTPESQETYEYYKNKKKFWNTMFWMEKKGIIIINDGTIRLSKLYGSLVMWIFNYLYDVDANENHTLKP